MASNVKVFEITVPEKDDLRCAICRIVNCENEFLIYADFCSNKLKCRQFLQETPQAMTAPVTNRKIREAGGAIYVITTKDFFENYAFQDHCDALNIQVMDLLDPIPTYVYKACFLYTVECKLAPRWNKVGLYLVEGQHFLSSTESVNAIMLNIKEIQGNSARLQVEAVNLKIPFVRLNTARPLPHDMQPPVRVLPSMKMANVLRISRAIKEEHPFKDYEHLRAYWRDMHGYVLPDHVEGSLFYDIEFFYFKSRVFLYPETCLASGPLRVLSSSTDLVPIIYKFAAELRGGVSKLCGQQLDVCPESTYRAALQVRTPVLPKTVRFSGYDTGYGTGSRTVNSMATPRFRVPDTCEVPIKRMRMSLVKTDDSFTCGTEAGDFDFGIGPTSSASKSQRRGNVGDLSVILHDVDDTKVIVPKDESQSHYFGDEEAQTRPEKSADKEEKPDKLSLREKLLKARGDE
ncbi:uncharacterized protein C18orf63-like [Harpegnathos saltator]|uniref:uncharacterized protein C18orf63-like n=1 Tax=Harpegnathos saltator TaxID=610380 RepID=UPI00058FE559|nr:uncharacterized protein C18orf63-like [Harpegnathos saltator]